ncbi:MAG: bifunctional phosphoribosylaminoimidazolecarboxamide formyltransferase/IMP cyclohydrolase [Candidatus Gastranaerophilales bacterium]|nr:bifunctional phosphoribosylaminoimidazolecarboxamide formyltransferase/IMP cyclohydrolase [Candidatus Gastranaerophilales bacterium]
MRRRAYISVFDKDDIVDFAKELIKNKFEIVSTGGTYDLLKKNGILATEVSEVTGFPEMLSGKVKSLHPAIFGGILADVTKSTEVSEIQKLNICPFDMVVVNLYPFEKIAQQTDNVDELIKNIDIGGVALLRAGAKNYKNVTVICDKSDYNRAINANESLRQEFALKTFELTSNYDSIIYSKLSEQFNSVGQEYIYPCSTYRFKKVQDLRYGENPHQKAGLYEFCQGGLGNPPYHSPLTIHYSLLWGKELSYNNILDMTAATNIVSEFYDVPAVAIVKHLAPCGVALGKNILEAYQKAFDCDPISAFGGIVAFSQEINEEVAKLLNSVFLEVIIAPSYTEKALEILKSKKNIRLIKLGTSLEQYKQVSNEEIKITPFGVLIQEADKKELDKDTFKVVTKVKPTTEQIEDAIFAWKVCKHAKSNAIVIAKNFKTLAIGQGQTNRVCTMEWALDYACDKSKDAVAASDGFFPAIDNIQAAVQGRIGLIIQPGGSIKDNDVIAEADKYGIAMITTGIRHFKH